MSESVKSITSRILEQLNFHSLARNRRRRARAGRQGGKRVWRRTKRGEEGEGGGLEGERGVSVGRRQLGRW